MWKFVLAWGLVAFLVAPGTPAALAGSAPAEHQVKAAFLVNFVRFVEWPDGASGASEALILEINPAAAARAHLKISSKLLQLAVIAGGKPEVK